MRRQILHPLLAFPLFLTSVLPYALAQTGKEQIANDSMTAEQILVARGPYTLHEDFARCWGDGQTLPERAQRRPVPAAQHQIRYPRRRGYGIPRRTSEMFYGLTPPVWQSLLLTAVMLPQLSCAREERRFGNSGSDG
jgi:hypothetical protein